MKNSNGRRDPNEIMKTLVDSVDEFSGFIMGVGNKNDIYSFGSSESSGLLGSALNMAVDNNKKAEENENWSVEADAIRRGVFSSILDTSIGSYYAQDIINESALFGSDLPIKAGVDISEYMMILVDQMDNPTGNTFPATAFLKDVDGKTPDNESDDTLLASMQAMVREYEDASQTSTFEQATAFAGTQTVSGTDEAATRVSDDFKARVGESAEDNLITATEFENFSEAEKLLFFKDIRMPTRYSDIVNKGNTVRSPSLTDKKMSSFIIKDREFCYGNRRIDFLSIFFNGISPIEMARCTPYIEMVFYHQTMGEHNQNYLNPSTYMKFYGNLKDGKLQPAKFNNSYPFDEKDENNEIVKTDIAFMDLFTAPQTMVNANINNEPGPAFDTGATVSNPFNDALEPFAPQATLNSLTVATTSGGQGFTSEKKGNISITVHDRSRMRDFAPILSINQMASSRIKITFGWSHPDGAPNSNNPIGRFLDSMKITQYFSTVSSNLRVQGNSVEVDMSIFSLGDMHVEDYPAAAGLTVPLRNIAPTIETVITSFWEEAKQSVDKSVADKVSKIHPQLDLIIKAANASETVVSVIEMEDIQDLINRNVDGKLNEQIVQRIAIILGIPREQVVTSAGLKSSIEQANKSEQNNSNTLDEKAIMQGIRTNTGMILRNKLETLTSLNDSNKLLQPDYFGKKCLVKGAQNTFNINGVDIVESVDYVSFGKCVANFVAAPLLASGEYSEVQLFFYPMNLQCGAASVHTTASLPVRKDEIQVLFESKDDSEENEEQESIKMGTISVKSAFRKLASLTQTTDFDAYGLVTVSPTSQQKSVDAELEKCKSNDTYAKETYLNPYFAENPGTPAEGDKEAVKGAKEKYDAAEPEAQEAALKMLISQKIQEKFDTARLDLLERIYASTGLSHASKSFRFPALNMSLEVLPAIKTIEKRLDFSVFSLASAESLEPDTGHYHSGGRILRIHITDNAVLGSDAADLATEIMYSGIRKISGDKALNEVVANGINNMSNAELKEYIKRKYATIVYGTPASTVKSINISSTTSDRISQAKMMTLMKKQRSKGVNKSVNSIAEAVTIIPASIDLQMLGCPYVERGSTLFIDMGTNTDLDNNYIVNSVTHTINKGEFTTSLGLVVGHQGTVTNVRGAMMNKLDAVLNPGKIKGTG